MSSESYAAKIASIHGDQSWGALFAEGDGEPIPFTDNNAAAYLRESLKILKITPERLSRMEVFNIGSGREAILFQQMGAAHVTLLDLAPRNVENVRRYAARQNVRNLTALCADIQSADLPAGRYDLAFLAAVYPHIETPARALIRLARALKVGGCLYLGFSRSGEWKYFVVDAIRYLLEGVPSETLRRKIALSCTLGQSVHYQMGRMMIDFFSPCQHKFHPDDILHDVRLLGLEVLHFDGDLREYAHEGKDYFSIGGDRIYLIKREEPVCIPDLSAFRTVRGRHQLWDLPYREAPIRANLERIRRIRSLIDQKRISSEEAAVLAINLYRFTRPFVPGQDEYYQQAIRDGRHATLATYLDNVIRLYEG